MACEYPFIPTAYNAFYRCGRCLSCRTWTKSVWSTRLVLEALDYEDCAFVTLTYKSSLKTNRDTLVKADLQSFQKRLRRVLDYKIRFYSVGEYGDARGRPHYHCLIYGIKQDDWLKIYHAWNNQGIVEIQKPKTNQSVASYVAGYVTKKIGTIEMQREYFGDRLPPFQICSKGLGLKSFLRLSNGRLLPYILIQGKKRWVGRFLYNKAREIYMSPEQIEQEKSAVKQQMFDIMRELEQTYEDKYLKSPQTIRKKFNLFRFAWRDKYQGTFELTRARDSLNSRTKDLHSLAQTDLDTPACNYLPYSNRIIGKIYEWSSDCIKIGAYDETKQIQSLSSA